MLKSQSWKNKIVTKMWRLKRWWHLSKLLTITMTSLILGIFFSCPVKLWKNLKLKFRSKFNTGYLRVVWKALYDFNPIDDELLFRACSWIGGTKKVPLTKICLTYPPMMALDTVMPYPKKIPQIYKSRDTPLEFWWHQHFSPKISKFCYTKKYRYRLHLRT